MSTRTSTRWIRQASAMATPPTFGSDLSRLCHCSSCGTCPMCFSPSTRRGRGSPRCATRSYHRAQADADRGGLEVVEGFDPAGPRVDRAEGEDGCRAALHAGPAAHALRVLHRPALPGEAHDIDALVAHGRADIARNALLLLGEDAEAREPRDDVHPRRERAGEAAPGAPAEPEIRTVAEDAGEEHVHRPLVTLEEHRVEQAVDRSVGRLQPPEDAHPEQHDCDREHDL